MKESIKKDIPLRVSHEKYTEIVESRKKQGRIWSILFGVCGFLSILAVVLGLFVAHLGLYTKSIATDIIVFVFIFFTGVVFINHAKYLWFRFPCRFCLKDNPEGATYCMSCNADMLSNEILPEHKNLMHKRGD